MGGSFVSQVAVDETNSLALQQQPRFGATEIGEQRSMSRLQAPKPLSASTKSQSRSGAPSPRAAAEAEPEAEEL